MLRLKQIKITNKNGILLWFLTCLLTPVFPLSYHSLMNDIDINSTIINVLMYWLVMIVTIRDEFFLKVNQCRIKCQKLTGMTSNMKIMENLRSLIQIQISYVIRGVLHVRNL